ncbi:MAG: purine-nucleoside phosphorylase [Candidatus Kapabacteria bacterium]|nr:purine-nucleoside phosphorylase [Candidatus Kapabacteria bacterium]
MNINIYQSIAQSILHQLPLDGVDVMLIAGSGIMSAFTEQSIVQRIPYSAFEGLPQTGVAGHVPELMVMELGDSSSLKRILVFGGRFHLYEGYSVDIATAPIHIASHLGIRNCILTNAAGGLNPHYSTGDLMLIDDLINMSGIPVLDIGVGDMAIIDNQSKAWGNRVELSLCSSGIAIWRGTYVAVSGPSYETRAEVRMYRKMADAIGMSTLHEWRSAQMQGMNVCGCSMITNTLSDTARQSVTHGEVLEATRAAQNKIAMFVVAAVHHSPEASTHNSNA